MELTIFFITPGRLIDVFIFQLICIYFIFANLGTSSSQQVQSEASQVCFDDVITREKCSFYGYKYLSNTVETVVFDVV